MYICPWIILNCFPLFWGCRVTGGVGTVVDDLQAEQYDGTSNLFQITFDRKMASQHLNSYL